MNPVHVKPTVEVIRGFHTSDQTLDILRQLFSHLEKEAIVVDDLPGFVSNRISHLFMNEAAFVLQDHVTTAENIDSIFKKCFGHKMGPLETADLIGLDTVVRSLDVLYESFQDPKYRCCPLLRKLVHAGHLGRKTGQGILRVSAQRNEASTRGSAMSTRRRTGHQGHRQALHLELGQHRRTWTTTTNLFESGIVNSLFAVQLMTFIEKTFAIEVGMDDLDIENFKSLSATTAFVSRKTRSAAA